VRLQIEALMHGRFTVGGPLVIGMKEPEFKTNSHFALVPEVGTMLKAIGFQASHSILAFKALALF
jgi:hypothetical protein